MGSPSLDPWMREIGDASKLAEEVNEMLGQRSSLPLSGPQTQRHMSTARRKMTILRTKLETLHSLLPGLQTDYRITTREMNRRRDTLSCLSLRAGEMAPMLNMSLSADRDNLLGIDRKQNNVMKLAEVLGDKDLLGFQQQIVKDQDEELAKLEETVVSTKHIALAVNEELDLHSRLIENIDEHVESTYSRLQRLKGRLGVLNRKTKGGCSSLILLILAVVVLIIIIWGILKYL